LAAQRSFGTERCPRRGMPTRRPAPSKPQRADSSDHLRYLSPRRRLPPLQRPKRCLPPKRADLSVQKSRQRRRGCRLAWSSRKRRTATVSVYHLNVQICLSGRADHAAEASLRPGAPGNGIQRRYLRHRREPRSDPQRSAVSATHSTPRRRRQQPPRHNPLACKPPSCGMLQRSADSARTPLPRSEGRGNCAGLHTRAAAGALLRCSHPRPAQIPPPPSVAQLCCSGVTAPFITGIRNLRMPGQQRTFLVYLTNGLLSVSLQGPGLSNRWAVVGVAATPWSVQTLIRLMGFAAAGSSPTLNSWPVDGAVDRSWPPAAAGSPRPSTRFLTSNATAWQRNEAGGSAKRVLSAVPQGGRCLASPSTEASTRSADPCWHLTQRPDTCSVSLRLALWVLHTRSSSWVLRALKTRPAPKGALAQHGLMLCSRFCAVPDPSPWRARAGQAGQGGRTPFQDRLIDRT
jgi:hypothetical protein